MPEIMFTSTVDKREKKKKNLILVKFSVPTGDYYNYTKDYVIWQNDWGTKRVKVFRETTIIQLGKFRWNFCRSILDGLEFAR